MVLVGVEVVFLVAEVSLDWGHYSNEKFDLIVLLPHSTFMTGYYLFAIQVPMVPSSPFSQMSRKKMLPCMVETQAQASHEVLVFPILGSGCQNQYLTIF